MITCATCSKKNECSKSIQKIICNQYLSFLEIDNICENCGKIFKSQNKYFKVRFCNASCRMSFGSAKLWKEKKKTGIIYRKYSHYSNLNYDDFIYNKYGKRAYKMTCSICGKDKGYLPAWYCTMPCYSCSMKLTRKYTPVQKRLNDSMESSLFLRLKKRNIKRNGNSTFLILGYTLKQLMEHLEKQFTNGMSWDNYGRCEDGSQGWQIDHIRPDSSFEYKSYEDTEFKKCWSLENLQPLWEKDNKKKAYKYYGEDLYCG